jgi:mRNA-degrading endonuclease RelE of RelBE toxin-antitoxin system
MRYRIEWDPETVEHMACLSARDEAIVLDAVPVHLSHQPTVRTRNRKPMEANPVASWELRIGNLRVYYEVSEEPEAVVTIRAVGLKDRNRVYIAVEEIEL